MTNTVLYTGKYRFSIISNRLRILCIYIKKKNKTLKKLKKIDLTVSRPYLPLLQLHWAYPKPHLHINRRFAFKSN